MSAPPANSNPPTIKHKRVEVLYIFQILHKYWEVLQV